MPWSAFGGAVIPTADVVITRMIRDIPAQLGEPPAASQLLLLVGLGLIAGPIDWCSQGAVATWRTIGDDSP